MDAVSQILSARSQDTGGMQGVLGASLLVHLALIAMMFFAPGAWFGAMSPEPEVVMTISLGGPVGPRDGGMTPMGGRPVQAISEIKRAIEPVRPPAAKAPEMIEPKKTAPKKAEAKVTDTAKTPRGRTPTTGEEVRKGSAVSAAQSARGQGFGLSSGGGGTGSVLHTANFCCPEYVALMLDAVNRNWDHNQQAAGVTVIKYTIERDGRLTNIQLERSSGYPTLDYMAQRALQATRQLPPLPGAFTEPSLTVSLTFEYSRR
ncbi:MAG TPA: TonB family protein [Vicinamibacterales bacterium]|nr:TonB family protein [Vicinamibacterales bacterium]